MSADHLPAAPMLDAPVAGLPVTAAQSEILVAQQLDPQSAVYNLSLVVEAVGPIDLERAVHAIRRTVARAEALHVRFRAGEDRTVRQVPAPPDAWPLEVVDVRGAADPEVAAQEWMDRDMATVVDVTGDDALFAHALLRLADDHTVWYQRYHHSIIDGFGISLIVADMVARYDDPDLESTVGEWALRDLVDADVDYRGSARFEADRDYWLTEVLDSPEPPQICAAGADTSGTPESTTVTIDAAIADALYAFASAAGIRRTRLPMALLVAYLHRVTGMRDLTVSVAMAARVGRALRRTPGLVSTIVPVMFHVDPDGTVGDLAREIDARLVAPLRHGRYRGADLERDVHAIDSDRRVFGPGINAMMFEHVRELGGHPARIRGSVTGPVRDLDFAIHGGEDGEPIRIDLRAPAGHREELLRHEEGLAHFVSQFLRDPLAVVGSLEPAVDAGHDTVGVAAVTTGDVLPMPVVHRLSEWSGGTARFSQAVLLHAPIEATTENLTAAIQSVLDHHDGLRQRLTRHAPGVWSLNIAEHGRVTPSLRRVDVSGRDDAELRAVIVAERDSAAGRLDPEQGTMLEAVWFDAGPTELGRLLLVAHHLVVDDASWRVLLEDLPTAWEAAQSGRPAALDPIGTSLKEYADLVTAQAQLPARLRELAHWTEITAPGAELVPAAHGDATIGAEARRTVRLSVADTEAVFTALPTLAHADVTDVLVAALRIAVTRWFAERGRESDLLIDLARHGREELEPGVDLSRTVGWFTDITPVRLPGGADGLDALESVTEALRAAPDGGIGYGMLRFANARSAGLLAAGSPAQVLFSYRGRMPAGLVGSWAAALESDSPAIDPDADMGGPYRLIVDVRCEDTPEGPVLGAVFGWSEPDLTEADAKTIGDGWAAAVRGIVVESTDEAEIVGDDATATGPVSVAGGSGDPVPVAPVQRLHWLRHRAAGSSARADHAVALQLRERIDAAVLVRALDDVVDRHVTLRTVFAPDGPEAFASEGPRPGVDMIEVGDDDLRRRAYELAQLRIDLTGEAPLRVHLVCDDEGRQVLLLTMHYLAVDDGSVTVLLGDLLSAYAARAGGNEPTWEPLAVEYPDYVRWQKKLLGDPADPSSRHAVQLAYWRNRLSGMPVRLHLPAAAGVREPRREMVPIDIDADVHDGIGRLAGHTGTSMFMVLQAALATLLTRSGAGTDIPIGSYVTGRTEDVLAPMVGCFFNVVVMRTDTSGSPDFEELLARIRASNLEAFDHRDVGFADVAAELDSAVAVRYPQVMLVHHEQARFDALDGVIDGFLPVPVGLPSAELTLSFHEPVGSGPVRAHFDFSTGTLDRDAVVGWARELSSLLASVVKQGGTA
ncbi:condensation domain-containing protein [Prescottella agglutinans]|uniref:Condensation domain-containing protein n=1 Tax=Prescottella agglutinans TaxID=1644129 RepID=A0ABT6MLT9_9NOCA|nr:condensation domain-containing protein [Prescottella agglutinans]MDH6284886.1 hypothetical protein [Prescottella agglutinans]